MLEIQNIGRSFGELKALNDVSFTVSPGKVTGFVGGNGAGKTTAMRIIMGLLSPDSGQVLWNGSPITGQVRAEFGYMPEERGLYPKQSVLSQLVFMGEIHGMSPADAKSAATELLTRFGLGERTKDKLEALSLGNQQRVQIIAAVIASPIGLILDEPFSGLDPAAVDEMFDILLSYVRAGVPVLFSSHQLDLVQRLADHVIVLTKGQVVAQGSVEELVAQNTKRHVISSDTDLGWIRSLPGLEAIDVEGSTATFALAHDEAGQHLVAEVMKRGRLLSFNPIVPSLSEIYRGVTA